ncbi:MAG: endolytic transglycosylase MltG [bacterium]|nr:endolytic transglycosylase MltG [bacterium]
MEFHLRRYALNWGIVLVALILFFMAFSVFAGPPRDFPAGAVIVVAKGASAGVVAHTLADARIIRHPEFLRLLWRVTGTGKGIPMGAYRFATPQNLFIVAWRLAQGDYGIPSTRITFVEGTTVREMAAKIADALPEISADDFISAAQPYEGYLFPDTYSFPPSASAESVVTKLRDTFDTKTAPLSADIALSGHSLSDIIVMASIVEREAKRSEDRRMIAGILWHRIALAMPLQVDAVFGYIYGRTTYSPSIADLKIDSPYNTYKYAGLPAGPICNPGLSAIEATLHPAETKYLYYLTGHDGLMHYATTYAGHKANVKAYLY